jgi:hypothetical protein
LFFFIKILYSMKKLHLPFIFWFSLLLAGTFLVASCRSCNIKPCNLPAPEDIEVSVEGPTKATLKWAPVTGANGYSILVTDSTASSLFGTFSSQQPQLELSQLVPDHVYNATVSADCEGGVPSTNVGTISWKQSNLIVTEVVVMFQGSGLGNCDCEAEEGFQPTPFTTDQTINLGSFNFSSSGTERAVYKIALGGLSTSGFVKLAFDENCEVVKIDPRACGMAGVTVNVEPEGSGHRTVFGMGSGGTITLIATMNSSMTEGHFDLSFDNCSGCTFNYMRCDGAWTGDCN